MKRITVILLISALVIFLFASCGKTESGKIKYSEITGDWCSEEGDYQINFGGFSDSGLHSGTIRYYEEGELKEDGFGYKLDFDENTKENSLVITIDGTRETYEIKLTGDELALTFYDEETGRDEVTTYYKGRELVEPETASSGVPATTTIRFSTDEPNSSTADCTMTCIIKSINGTVITAAKTENGKETESLYNLDYAVINNPSKKTFAEGDAIEVVFRYPIEETYPMGVPYLIDILPRE
ncbi:MAG: hypothetical protein MJ125_04685 [Clostridia bacterium]|nr:hypothetical protein [Clostridia bacterium]